MEDSYVVCIRNDVHPAEHLLIVGNKYHVEDSFNFDPDKNTWGDTEGVREMLEKYPNPFFYLEEIQETCSCCGQRQYFWHGLFETKEQHLSHASMEAFEKESEL